MASIATEVLRKTENSQSSICVKKITGLLWVKSFPKKEGDRKPVTTKDLVGLWEVQFSSVTWSCLTICNSMDWGTPGFPVHHQLPELTQTRVHQVGDAIRQLNLYHALLLPPLVFPSSRLFSNESVLRIRWPKCWSFSFSISPYNEYSGLISFWMDWLDLLVVQGTLKSLLQHHSSKASILRCSAFF